VELPIFHPENRFFSLLYFPGFDYIFIRLKKGLNMAYGFLLFVLFTGMLPDPGMPGLQIPGQKEYVSIAEKEEEKTVFIGRSLGGIIVTLDFDDHPDAHTPPLLTLRFSDNPQLTEVMSRRLTEEVPLDP
jgi:hypothetical protein